MTDPLMVRALRETAARRWAKDHDPIVRIRCSRCHKADRRNGIFATDVGLAIVLVSPLGAIDPGDRGEWTPVRDRPWTTVSALLDDPWPIAFRCICATSPRPVDIAAARAAARRPGTRRGDILA